MILRKKAGIFAHQPRSGTERVYDGSSTPLV